MYQEFVVKQSVCVFAYVHSVPDKCVCMCLLIEEDGGFQEQIYWMADCERKVHT